MRVVAAFCVVATLAGCATQAERKLEAIKTGVQTYKAELQACNTAVRTNPSYAELLIHLPTGRPSLAQLADETCISDKDRSSYLQFTTESSRCRAMSLEEAGRLSPAMQSAVLDDQNRADKIRLALVQRQLTWGQFYQTLLDNQSKTNTTVQAADRELMGNLRAEHQEEMANRARAAAAFAAAAQQMNENMQRQQLINAINRPVNTTCNRFGDQVNCTTY